MSTPSAIANFFLKCSSRTLPDSSWSTCETAQRKEKFLGPLGFVDGLGMDGDAVDWGELLLDAIFEGGGDVVNLSDGERAVHGAVAGDEDFVLDDADVNIVAIGELMIFGAEAVDEVADADREFLHFLAAGNVRAKRLDVNIDVRTGCFAEQILLEGRGEAMRFAQAGMLVDFEMQFDEEPAVNLMRG